MAQSHRTRTKKAFVRQLRSRATPAERRLRKLLSKHKIKYHFQRAFDIKYQDDTGKWIRGKDNKFYIVDFFLPYQATIIEIDGEAHSTRESKDIKRTLDLIQHAYKGVQFVLRFTNQDIIFDHERVIRIILSLKCVRVKNKDKKHNKQNKLINQEIARRTEIAALVKIDKDTPWWKKKQLLQSL